MNRIEKRMEELQNKNEKWKEKIKCLKRLRIKKVGTWVPTFFFYMV